MGRRPRRLEAAALVDRDVDQHRAALHAGEMRAGDKLRRAGARNQHRADDDVGVDDFFLDRLQGREARANAAGKQLVQDTQPRQRAVEHDDVGAETGRHSCGMGADHPAADHRDPAGATPGTPPISLPMPSADFRKAAPAASIASRPATSLIGASSGSPPWASVTVS